MKSLVVYYSRTGNTRKVAEKIREKLDADIEEIVDKKSRKGIMGFLSGGMAAARRKPTEIKEMKKDSSEYDLVIVGTPVWAGNMAPAVRTYLSAHRLKKAAFFSTSGSRDIGKTFKEMLRVMKGNVVGTLKLTEAEVKQDMDEKIEKFAEMVKK